MSEKHIQQSESNSRRSFLKRAGGIVAGSALGSLAGCAGGDGTQTEDTGEAGGDGTSGQTSSGSGASATTEASSSTETDGGGGSGSVTISFLSAFAIENQATRRIFDNHVGRFQEQEGDVTVNIQRASYDDIRSTLSSRVSGGHPPTLAESGAIGLEYFRQGDVPNHGPWIEQTENFPEDWIPVNETIANFRGEWWTSGTFGVPGNSLGIRPKLFSQIGITDPFEELKTWSQVYDALSTMSEELPNVIPWEETGTPGDLESYWGEARTAHTGGKDPWIRGDPTDPDVQIGDNPRTDGLIKNCVKLAHEFSSEDSAGRTNEELPSLMLTDRVASFPQIQNSFTAWTSIKEDVTFGWQDGEGDIMMIPHPKLDPDYGAEVGISELEGLEGEHGGHLWGLENAHTVFDVGDDRQMDKGWDLAMFLHQDEEFMLDLVSDGDPLIPSYSPLLTSVENNLDLPQLYTQLQTQIQDFGSQYNNTGGPWDVGGTDQIRWTDINQTISEAIAGQRDVETLPSQIRDRVDTTLENQNN